MSNLQLGLVSTIIPVYNRFEMLNQAVQSVLDQTYRPIEIIIVDDGSIDDTPYVADAMARRFPEEIKVLHIRNCGPGLAREAGRQIARGEFIQYLDSDDILSPRKFEIQVEALRDHPECGVAYGYTRLVNERGEVLKAPYKLTHKTFSTLFPWLLVERWWNTHTPLFLRSVCDRVGPWADMQMSEDWEYDARVGSLNTKLVHCREFLSDTHQHQDSHLTGRLPDSKMIKDMSRLINTLYDSARRVGVSQECPEMRHFSRWAFLIARQAGSLGMASEAEKCFKIARASALEVFKRKSEFRIYEILTRILGWKLTGRLTCQLDRILKRKSSPDTIKQLQAGTLIYE